MKTIAIKSLPMTAFVLAAIFLMGSCGTTTKRVDPNSVSGRAQARYRELDALYASGKITKAQFNQQVIVDQEVYNREVKASVRKFWMQHPKDPNTPDGRFGITYIRLTTDFEAGEITKTQYDRWLVAARRQLATETGRGTVAERPDRSRESWPLAGASLFEQLEEYGKRAEEARRIQRIVDEALPPP